ncbi:uncharacterized protein A4U43_C02F12710 [Asparagus officinalis]|uniref:Nuclear pore complex protein NUP88 n=1 Tax=Asparagus officinalis TaxID=4686 RepID=A0A5P1FI01_ASPOF|nr:uncharacterized protein A4U43_C02F12710 [Asparagus officinalis]
MGGGARPPSTPKSKALELQWVPLKDHPVFKSTGGRRAPLRCAAAQPANIAAWGRRLHPASTCGTRASRHIHRLSLRFAGEDADEVEDGDVVLAASPSEVLMPDKEIKSVVDRISLNEDGSSLVIYGRNCVYFMNLYEKASSNGSVITYRTSNACPQIFSAHNNGLQILQVTWHPYGSSHVGILSSDSVLRLFDFSSDLERPEQEFYLQPYEVGSSHNAVSICPVAFSFGGQHLWDRFSVFVLFSDGSIYVLCPIIPFGSLCSWEFLEEIHEDVKVFGVKSPNAIVASNSNMALDWLEATFPELADESLAERNKLVLRAHPYAPLDASLVLQGPLGKICTGEDSSSKGADYEAKAVSFLYSSIGKDSILVIGWSDGQLQIDALADEIQPLWTFGSAPRLRVDSYDRIKGVAMICESNSEELSSKLSDTSETMFSGPPLLRLATVDLSLPRYALDNCLLALFPDPLLVERFYCLHLAGIDLISLHFLPFSNLLSETDKTGKEPSVLPILTTDYDESRLTSSLYGFAVIADPCGHSKVVGITSSYECIVLESKFWTEATALQYHMDMLTDGSSDTADIPEVISKELLSGPKAIDISSLTNCRSLTADSIEGRSILHHYIKLFHENYVEYAHKVFVELEHHEDYQKTIMANQSKRLHDAKQLLLNVEEKEQDVKDRISRAFKVYELLEQRLQNFRMLPGANKKPLSRAERDFKSQLEGFADVELDALHSSIESLNARVRRCFQSSPVTTSNIKQQSPGRRRDQVSDSQMQKIRSSMELLSLINKENTKKIDLIEHGLKKHQE